MDKREEAWRRLEKFCADKTYFAKNKEDAFEEDLRDILGMLNIATLHLKEGGEMPVPDLLCMAHKTSNCTLRSFMVETKRRNWYKISDIQKASFELLRDYIQIEKITTWEEAFLFLKSVFPKEEGGGGNNVIPGEVPKP